MKRIIVMVVLLLSGFIYPQLKSLEVKPTENRGQIPVLTEYPDKAGLYFYTSFDNLKFVSSYGINKIYNRSIGNYIVIVEPTRQSIEISAPGYKTEIIKITDLSPREFKYYTVEPKKEEEGIGGVKELAVTVVATPTDAEISIDGKPFKNDSPTMIEIGAHRLTVKQPGYRSESREITVSPGTTLFKVELSKIELEGYSINSEPTGAEIYIDGTQKGETNKSLWLYPGKYGIRLNKSGYLPIEEEITVIERGIKNSSNYKLIKNVGWLSIEIGTEGTEVTINKNKYTSSTKIELPPDIYTIEGKQSGYYSYSDTVGIELGKERIKVVELKRSTGHLKIMVTPEDSELKVNGEIVGSKYNEYVNPGMYIIEAKKGGYYTVKDTVIVEVQKGYVKEIKLEKNTGELIVNVEPKGSKIKVDGKEVKNGAVNELKPGVYKIEAIENLYEKWEDTVEVKVQTRREKSKRLEKNSGKIYIETEPNTAKVTINREIAESGKEIELAPGIYEIEVSKEKYESKRKIVELKRSEITRERIELKGKTGVIRILVNPSDSRVEIKIDGQKQEEIIGNKILKEALIGSYKITARQTGYNSLIKQIKLQERDTIDVEFQLEKVSDVVPGFIYVEGGTFQMGSNYGYNNEKPIHSVTVSSFYLSKYEVTVKEYRAFCTATGKSMPEEPDWGWNDNDPIVYVSWNDAKGYCDWAGVRLPTEAEWEYAAKGGNKSRGYTYSGSNNLEEVAWYSSNSNRKVHPVGTKAPNEIGIYDMSGNVLEWCSDWYDENYYKSSPRTNPTGPNSDSGRVLRGGSWGIFYNGDSCRSADRDWKYPESRGYSVGFRVARLK